jgi:peptide subunit release factor 1 (eRF1)
MTLAKRLAQLTGTPGRNGHVVSVYLNSHWTDEHQRDRARVFLKNELRRAREAAPPADLAAALDWVESQAAAVIDQTEHASARGVALFASAAPGLREVIPLRAPVEDTFVVAPRPLLGPLAASLVDATPALVIVVDTEKARLVPMSIDDTDEETHLGSEVQGHHKRGGWAQLAQSRYQRHIAEQRGRHFEAVAEAVERVIEEHAVECLVIAGSADVATAFEKSLSPRLAARIAGTMAGHQHEGAGLLVARAGDVVRRFVTAEAERDVDAVLTEAANQGRAAAGLEAVLEAVGRGAVERLYLLRGFREPGGACAACGGLQPGNMNACRVCGGPSASTELGEAMLERVLSDGGTVTTLPAHEALGSAGGLAARLRFHP